jgi:hypothetical protein
MTLAEARKRIAALGDVSLVQALDQILMTLVPDGAGPPFANPVSWTQFTLLGDAPVLPPLPREQHTQRGRKNTGATFWRWIKKIFSHA